MSKNRNLDHRNDWSTPKKEFLEWQNIYGFSDFDPCPIDGNISGYNGLAEGWEDRTFVNPPYSLQDKKNFVLKGIEQWRCHNKRSCFLLPVSTSTMLFHQHIQPHSSNINFLKGRLRFEGVNNKGQWVNPGMGRKPHPAADLGLEQVKTCGMHDSMLVFFGDW